MDRFPLLMLPGRSPGHTRQALRGDVLYNAFRFREVFLTIVKKVMAPTRVVDGYTEEMCALGLISREAKSACDRAIIEALSPVDPFDPLSAEALYSHIHSIRLKALGPDAIEAYQAQLAQSAQPFTPNGICQQALKEKMLSSHSAILFAITQPELMPQLLADVAACRGKNLCFLCGRSGESLLSPEVLKKFITTDAQFWQEPPAHLPADCCLLAYGEESFTACRGLSLDAVVHGNPVGYAAQAVTNLWKKEGCVIYVPRGYDIAPLVPMTQKTRLTYSHLAALAEAFGEEIYALSPAELYGRYPQYFLNIYSNTPSGLPLKPQFAGEEDVFSQFDRQLDQELEAYLGSCEGAQYHSAYFDENLQRRPICYDATQSQPGILVQAAKVSRSEGAAILRCEKGVTPRQMLSQVPGVGLISNFLFFLTPKLGVLYNDLRADRPLEQADAANGHLDYMLEYRQGKRIETFPLFQKTGMAMTADGQFLFFNFRLGGGQITLDELLFRWEANQVDNDLAPIRLYTPYYSTAHKDAPRESYRQPVGQGRVNVVILRDTVTCIRSGDVLLPSVGVVLSLSQEAAAPLLAKCAPLENGYYDPSGLTLTVQLDAPSDVDAAQWAKVQWAYGGGLTLIKDGVGLCDGEHMQAWFDSEGWSSPLSRQTQESNLHSLVKHPRTAIGCTADGSLVVLVYSGRTWRSTGADYKEMIAIARQLFPDMRYLMNCDGGGSAMLGMVRKGEFLELSFPSTSGGSCAGQVRPINTLFYIPLKEEA